MPPAVSVVVGVLVVCLCVHHARVALRAGPRSRRRASFALAVGWPTFLAALYNRIGPPPEHAGTFRALGVVHLTLAAVGAGAVLAAVVARRRDAGAQPLALAGAAVLALLNGGAGGLYLLLTAAPFVPDPDAPDATGVAVPIDGRGVSVTLPDAGWKPKAKPKHIADFYRSQPPMMAGVFEVEPDATGEAFRSAVRRYRQLAREGPATRTALSEAEGENDHGYPTWMSLTEERDDRGRVFVGVSVTWLARTRVVVLVFEGQYERRSEAGAASERSLFRSSAERFLRSVR